MLSRIGHLQFVAQQLKLMREEGLTKREACYFACSATRDVVVSIFLARPSSERKTFFERGRQLLQ